jgi:hypothetical protein
MKVAYLITAYGEWRHLERLVGALDAPEAGFYIHIDAKSDVPEGFVERVTARGNVVFAPRRPVWWGGWSHTAALLSLMELAAGGDWDYCVLLSGGDYPIRSNREIFETLASGGEFINAAPGFRPDKPESRVRYYRFDGFDRRLRTPKTWLLRGVEALLRSLGIRKRRYPFERVYSGIVWSALSMGAVRYILEYVRAHPRFVRFFRTALVPEEMFFATIVGNSPFAADIRGTLTFMDWDHWSASPPRITEEYLPRLAPGVPHPHTATGRSYERLFARKFDDGSGAVLDRIDREFRNSD